MGKDRNRRSTVAPRELDADTFFGGETTRKTQRKELQLCRQVEEAIADALSAVRDELLQDVWVAAVEPAPNAARLSVVLEAPEDAHPDDVLQRIELVAGHLRSEVAQAITRKRAPTLTYRVVPKGVAG